MSFLEAKISVFKMDNAFMIHVVKVIARIMIIVSALPFQPALLKHAYDALLIVEKLNAISVNLVLSNLTTLLRVMKLQSQS
jgi:hypothetical protein